MGKKEFCFLTITFPRTINSQTGRIKSAMPLPKINWVEEPEDLGSEIGKYITTLSINLSQLYEDIGIPQDEYIAVDVQRLSGTGKSTLKNWVAAGIILPVDNQRGRGTRRKFSAKNLLDTKVCMELALLNIKPRFFKNILSYLENKSIWSEIGKTRN